MYRKIISFLAFSVILINICAVSVFAEASPTVRAGSASGKCGDVVEIPVILEDNDGFADLGVEIGYDDTAFTLKKVTPNNAVGTTFTGAQSLNINPYNVGWTNIVNTVFNGTLITFTFEIITDKSGDYPITVDYYKGRNGNYKDGVNINYDENLKPLNLKYVSGAITVKGDSGSMGEITVGGISFGITLKGETSTGEIYAGLYDENDKLKNLKIYQASEKVTVEFDSGITGAYAKIMWWNDNMKPMSGAQYIPLR